MKILEMIYKRLTRIFAKKGYVTDEGPVSGDDDVEANLPMPFRPRAPKAYRRRGRLLANPLYQHPDPDVMSVQGWCNVRYRWFSLHAAVKIEGTAPCRLKTAFSSVFCWGARSSVNLSLLSYVEPDDPDRSELELRFKRKWSDGSESLIFSQRDFVERLAGVIPPLFFGLV